MSTGKVILQGAVGCSYCFIDVLIKSAGSVRDARMFKNSALNGIFRDGTIPKCQSLSSARMVIEYDPSSSTSFPCINSFFKICSN